MQTPQPEPAARDAEILAMRERITTQHLQGQAADIAPIHEAAHAVVYLLAGGRFASMKLELPPEGGGWWNVTWNAGWDPTDFNPPNCGTLTESCQRWALGVIGGMAAMKMLDLSDSAIALVCKGDLDALREVLLRHYSPEAARLCAEFMGQVAFDCIRENWPIVQAVAAELKAKGELDGAEVLATVKRMQAEAKAAAERDETQEQE